MTALAVTDATVVLRPTFGSHRERALERVRDLSWGRVHSSRGATGLEPVLREDDDDPP